MRRYIFLLILILAFGPDLRATVYYVSTGGDDQNSGIDSTLPLASISRAMDLVHPGDTIYLRGGIYLMEQKVSISNSGLPGLPNRLWAYPGELPVLDYSAMPPRSTDRGITLNARYWHIRGIEVVNAGDNGLIIESGHFNLIEHCVFRNNGDTGLQISGGSAYNEVINCDSYFNADPTYENADGFAAKIRIGSGNRFVGCRAWNNADDGWDLYEGEKPVSIHHCIAFRNGYLKDGSPAVPNGDMNGFKLGGNHVAADHLVTHCIAFHNGAKGFDQNNNTGIITLYNNTAWQNGTYYAKPNFSFPSRPNIFRNNVSYQGADQDRLSAEESQGNSWDGLVVGDEDFISLDTAPAVDPRLPDGNLPLLDLLRPAPGEVLVDAGVETGYPFLGDAPDVGAFESATPGAGRMVTMITFRSVHGITDPASNLFPERSEVTVEAVPFEGYVFSGWTGSIESVDNPLVFWADSNVYLLPLFTEDTTSTTGPFDPAEEDIFFSIFPNPAEDVVYLIPDAPLPNVTLHLFDRSGRLIHKICTDFSTGDRWELDLSYRAPGIYFLRVDTPESNFYHKIVKH